MTMMILMMIVIIIVTIIAIMIIMIKIILIIAVIIIINSPFQPGGFSTGSTTGSQMISEMKFIVFTTSKINKLKDKFSDFLGMSSME